MNAGRPTVRRVIVLVFAAIAALPIAAPAATTNVALRNTKFEPATVTVALGDTVVWRNEDDRDHTVTSATFDSHPACQRPAIPLQDCMTEGETFSHTFNEPGELGYRCKLHPSMTGVVSVQPAAEVTTTTVATTATTQAPTTVTTAATTTTTRQLATSSTLPSSTTTTTAAPAESSTTASTNEAPAFDPDDGDGGTAAASSDGGGGPGTVALIVAALLAVAAGGGVLLWRLRPRPGGPPAGA